MTQVGQHGFSGGCLCGAVRYHSTADPQLVGQCHCVDCRKTSATHHAIHLVIPEDGFTVSGAVKFYDRPANSGNIVARVSVRIAAPPSTRRTRACTVWCLCALQASTTWRSPSRR